MSGFSSIPATAQPTGPNFALDLFANQIWSSKGLFDAFQARPDVQPNLIVGHSGFVSTPYLRELYDCPFIRYFELFDHEQDSDLEYRTDLSAYETPGLLGAGTRYAILPLDLQNCDRGDTPIDCSLVSYRFPRSCFTTVRIEFYDRS